MRHPTARRIFLLGLALVTVTAGAAAAATAGVQSPVMLEFWYETGAEATRVAMAEIVQAFEGENPDVKVNVSYLGNVNTWNDQFIASIAGGNPPDVAWGGCGGVHEYRAAGLVEPLNDHLADLDPAAVAMDAWIGAAVDECAYQGLWYALPFRTDIRGLFTNVNLFEEAGIPGTQGPRTIDDLDLMAQKLTRFNAEGEAVQLGFSPNGVNLPEVFWFHAFGGSFFDWERMRVRVTGNPANLEALEWWVSYADLYGQSARASRPRFYDESLAMYIASSGEYGRFVEDAPDVEFWTHPLPYQPGGRNPNMSAVSGPVLPVGAPHQAEAVRFLAYLARPEVQLRYFEITKDLPTRMEALRQTMQFVDDSRYVTIINQWGETSGRIPLWRTFLNASGVGLRAAWLPQLWSKELSPAAMLELFERQVNVEFEKVFPLE